MLVGREHEAQELNRLYESGEAEFVAIYGRRRVGKTYLVNETFSGRITFSHAGLSPADGSVDATLRLQLDHFAQSLELQGAKGIKRPKSWLEAFFLLEKHLQDIDDGSRQVVFLDELPWLDTPRSGFLTAFEAFWNGWGCSRKNLMVIVCGSATSWVLDRLVNNHGGLYNRLTYEIRLAPFTLGQCEKLLESRHVNMSRYDIAQAYMTCGGIPYYLNYFEGSRSLAQNIDALFFSRGAKLANEFDRLFDSVFTNPETEKAIVRFLNTRRRGFRRAEIADALGTKDGGRLSRNLKALIASDFVERYVPFGYGAREEHYRLIDPFCLYYLHFIDRGKGALGALLAGAPRLTTGGCVAGPRLREPVLQPRRADQACPWRERCAQHILGLGGTRRRARRGTDRPAPAACRQRGERLRVQVLWRRVRS